MSEFHKRRNALYAEFPLEAQEYEAEFTRLQMKAEHYASEWEKCVTALNEQAGKLLQAGQLLQKATRVMAALEERTQDALLRLAKAERLLEHSAHRIAQHNRGKTHWEGCERGHNDCAHIKEIRVFLANETKTRKLIEVQKELGMYDQPSADDRWEPEGDLGHDERFVRHSTDRENADG